MNNPIFEKVLESIGGNYCHCLEVNETIELEGLVDSVIEEYPDYKESEYLEFFQTMEIYFLGDDPEIEKAVFAFSFNDYIKGTI